MAATTYIANDNIQHNGIAYKTGDSVADLDNKQAQRLIDLGVLRQEESPDNENTKTNSGFYIHPDDIGRCYNGTVKVAVLSDEVEAAYAAATELATDPAAGDEPISDSVAVVDSESSDTTTDVEHQSTTKVDAALKPPTKKPRK